MQQSEHDTFINNCKGILILLVVLGHSLEFLREDFFISKYIYMFIYSFHMPVFIFISGYLSKNIDKVRDEAVKNFFVPYLFFNLIWIILKLIGFIFFRENFVENTDYYYFSLLTPGWALWYILALFFWKMFLKDLLKIKNIVSISLLFGVFSGFFKEFNTFVSLSRIVSFTPFFLAGYFSKKELLDAFRKKSKLLSIVIIILTIVCNYLLIKINMPTEFFWMDKPFYSFGISNLFGVFLKTVIYILGFLFIFVFCNLVTVKENIFTKFGKNTFSIYLLHTFLLGICIGISYFINNDVLKLIFFIIVSIFITYILGKERLNTGLKNFLARINSEIFKDNS